MRIECVIRSVFQVFRNDTTKKKSIHLIVDVVCFVPCEVRPSYIYCVAALYSLVKSKQNKRLIRVEVRDLEQGDKPILQPLRSVSDIRVVTIAEMQQL